MAKKKSMFPKTMYVHVENEGEGADEFFSADTAVDTLKDGQRVAVYELREVRTMQVTRELK